MLAVPVFYAVIFATNTVVQPLPGGGKLVAAVASKSSFRLGVTFETDRTMPGGLTPLASPSLEPSPAAEASKVSWGGMAGLQTRFGAILISPSGSWVLYDDRNRSILAGSAPVLTAGAGAEEGVIQLPVINGSGMHGGAEPCLSNGKFAPPYYWDSEAGFFAFAVSPWDYDPAYPEAKAVHCYPASFSDGAGGYSDPNRDWVNAAQRIKISAPPQADTCKGTHSNTDVNGGRRSGSFPGGTNVTDGPTGCCKVCDAAETAHPGSDKGCTGWVATADGKPDGSGMNCWPFSKISGTHHRADRTYGGRMPPPPPPPPPPPKGRTGWWIAGRAADWYLAPARYGYDFTSALYEITGAPRVPPRYALAFMATYWGYSSMEMVESNMTAMRDQLYPIDSFIMDYDWFGPQPAGPCHSSSCPPAAQAPPKCPDFGCGGDYGYATENRNMFGNHTFVRGGRTYTTSTAKELLTYFHEVLDMKWAGIRKPRSYSNVALSNASGWMLAADTNVGAGGNNWNFTVRSLREWYAAKHQHFLDDGVDFWWNDEGETQWFTYHYWNLAQQAAQATARPNSRFFTINRAFTPGMQRYPASTWTGDRQDCSHQVMLRFSMYGQPYHECDMTSENPTDLLRQYQNAVFSPVMRVHQMHGVPRFPYLWCDGARGGNGQSSAEHCVAFRQALDLRYAFVPYVYSLAHAAHEELRPIARPALFEFPDWTHPTIDDDSWGSWHTYMFGTHVVAANLGFRDGAARSINASVVALPPGPWFRFNSTAITQGDRIVTEKNLALTDSPVYIRPGAVLTLNKERVQFSESQGGLLEVQVYGGGDGSFTLREDDGATLDYLAGKVRKTTFSWSDATKTLSWVADMPHIDAGVAYDLLEVAYFEYGANTVQRSAQKKIGTSGSVKMH